MADIVNRVRKLLQLSKRNDNPAEAANAAALAADLMFRYQLGEAEVNVEQTEREAEDVVDEAIHNEKRRDVWKATLAHQMGKAFGCNMYSSHQDGGISYKIVGLKSTVQTVSYLFQYLQLEIIRLTEEAWNKSDKSQNGKTWKNSFRLGAVNTVAQRLRDQQRAQEMELRVREHAAKATGNTCTGIALYRGDQQRVEDTYKEIYKAKRLRKGSASYTRHSPTAYNQGQSAGRGISLSNNGKGIGASKQRIAG